MSTAKRNALKFVSEIRKTIETVKVISQKIQAIEDALGIGGNLNLLLDPKLGNLLDMAVVDLNTKKDSLLAKQTGLVTKSEGLV